MNTNDSTYSKSEAQHDVNRKRTRSFNSCFYNFYTEGKIIRPEILKEQQYAHLQTSFKQESNSKTMQVLSARGWGNTSSPVQDLFGLRKLYNLL